MKGKKKQTPRKVSSSEMKNGWHSYLERVVQAREEIIITRYGKPIAKLTPFDGDATAGGIFGFLAGTVTVHGDIIATGEDWEADA
ncbi:MAG: type II toxin-antitoxin system Phd/YefM family antitoxin [Gemmatimonadota bacterium]